MTSRTWEIDSTWRRGSVSILTTIREQRERINASAFACISTQCQHFSCIAWPGFLVAYTIGSAVRDSHLELNFWKIKQSQMGVGVCLSLTDRQIDRQTQTDRQTDRQKDRHTHTHTESAKFSDSTENQQNCSPEAEFLISQFLLFCSAS